jgi:hypothetical protein
MSPSRVDFHARQLRFEGWINALPGLGLLLVMPNEMPTSLNAKPFYTEQPFRYKWRALRLFNHCVKV